VVIVTKFGWKHGEKGPHPSQGPDSRPEQIRRVAEASLKRLRVEAIDLFYQHRPDPIVPIPGSRKLERLDENIGAANVQLTPADSKQRDETMSHITVVGDRY
jgi:aryl-alcohol dehydrogenase-like predicted oxidoreductase